MPVMNVRECSCFRESDGMYTLSLSYRGSADVGVSFRCKCVRDVVPEPLSAVCSSVDASTSEGRHFWRCCDSAPLPGGGGSCEGAKGCVSKDLRRVLLPPCS